jgi:hypothetical protein
MHGHSVHAEDGKSILKVTHGHMHGHNVHAGDKTNALMGIMDLTKNSQ